MDELLLNGSIIDRGFHRLSPVRTFTNGSYIRIGRREKGGVFTANIKHTYGYGIIVFDTERFSTQGLVCHAQQQNNQQQ
jgi:hypothetical protein